jgi:hypothetical protein
MNKISSFLLVITLIFIGCKKESNSENSFGGGNLTINSQMSLDAAISSGNSLDNIVGNLIVNTALQDITVADVKQITSQIKSVDGNVDINTPDGSLDLSQLTTVGGNYTIEGSDASDDNLTKVDGDILLNYDGDYDMPNLTTVGNIVLTPFDGSSARKNMVGTRRISFRRVNACSSFSLASQSPGILAVPRITRIINCGPGIMIKSLSAPSLSSLVLSYPSPLPSLNIVAPLAETIDISSTAINGLVNIIAPSSTFNAPALATIQGDINLTCGILKVEELTTISGNASLIANKISANNITSVSGNLSIFSSVVSMTTLNTIGGNLTIKGIGTDTSAESVNIGSLTNIGGELEIDSEEISQNLESHNSGGN